MSSQYETAHMVAAMLLRGQTAVCAAYNPELMRSQIALALSKFGVLNYESKEVLLCGVRIQQMF